MKSTNKTIIFWVSVLIIYTIIVGSIGIHIGRTTDNKTEVQISTTETTTKPVKKTTKKPDTTKTTKATERVTTTKKATTTKKETTTTATTTMTTTTKENDESGVVSLGTFKLTAYCNCETCCGVWSGGATASGTMPRSSRTIAVDTDIIPFGTEVIINGNLYVAEDTGSAIIGNRIDIYMDSHSTAQEFGVQYAEVFVER